jgi:hypothetical protein
MNNKNIQNIKPFIFTKKINNRYKVIPLNIITNTLGPVRYFPYTTKEWFNSVYAFNINSIKNLSVTDKNLIKLIKSYFNFYFSKKVLNYKRLVTRIRRLAINRIFVSKAELKHTSSKVIITLHVYNEERRVLVRKIKRLEAILFPLYYKAMYSQVNNKPFSIEEKLDITKIQESNISLINWLYELKSNLVQQIKLEENNVFSTKMIKEKRLRIENLNKDLISLINIIIICENDPISYIYYDKLYKDFIRITQLDKEINIIAYYKLLLSLNKSKFENIFLSKLKPLISKLYNKEVEFNIINLKTLYLNSDIFTEVISLKLKNRDNKLLRVLKSSLSMIKLSKVNKVREQYSKNNKKELWINKINNLNINSINNNCNKDILNQFLLDLFHNSSNTISSENNKNDVNNNLLSNFVLNSLKYKNMAGARLETKGRLTRRFTASRSVFKIKWKGSLKNIDSSYKGLSSVMLRGHVKSNIQYSSINSKTRNGAFGLKGWVSSK